MVVVVMVVVVLWALHVQREVDEPALQYLSLLCSCQVRLDVSKLAGLDEMVELLREKKILDCFLCQDHPPIVPLLPPRQHCGHIL